MKTFRFAFAAMVATLVLIAPAFGQRPQVRAQPARGGDAPPLLAADALEKLKLTSEQKEKYTKIEADYNEKTRAAQDAYRAAIGGVRDREKAKEAQEKMQTATKKAREDQLAKVEPILSPEQKTVFTQVRQQQQPLPGAGGRLAQIGGAGIGQVLPPAVQTRLQLTDEQKKEIEKIQKEAEAKIMKVLNDDQKKQLEQLKKRPAVRPLPTDPTQPRRIQAAPPAVPAPPAVEPKKQ